MLARDPGDAYLRCMFFDPRYLLYVGPGLLLALVASFYVKSTFRRFAEVSLHNGLSGAEAAAAVLRSAGLPGLRIEETQGFLADHYDPRTRTLHLSSDVYHGRSVSAAGVAAHEAGHAIQHAQGYALMGVRQALVLPANIGSQVGLYAVIFGTALHMFHLAWVGVFLFAAVVLFQLVTLPVELDASRRAQAQLVAVGAVDSDEAIGVRRVLNAAALTYLAGLVTAALQLLYFVTTLRGAERRD
jgi:Zn-dependent membrane protease YugP